MNIGDVVLCEYRTFDGLKALGLFIIIYHEKIDMPRSTNFTAIKVSSESYGYPVKLEKKYLTFLDHDSYLNCNQMFRFREEEVMKVLGMLTPYYMNRMIQQTSNYFRKMMSEVTMYIGQNDLFRDLETI